MFFYLSKIGYFLLLPSTWIIILLFWAWKSKHVKRKKYVYGISIFLFFFFSNRFVADEFVRLWEPARINIDSVNNTYDAVVVLGGYTTFDKSSNVIGFHESVDRILYGIYFYKQGIAAKIIISGGNARLVNDKEESLITKEYLSNIGITESDIYIENKSRNTFENAKFVAELIKEKENIRKVLLVTSAYHMPRAEKCFKKQQIKFDVFPVDYIAGPRKFYIDHLLLPDMEGFIIWQNLIHEWLGFLTYKALGYL